MKRLFVDTAGWMACANAADIAHEKACIARDAAIEQGVLLVTTNYVIDETLTLIRIRMNLKAAEKWWLQIESSSRLRWEWIDDQRAEKARALFFRHRDKEFSFTDCTSFVVMREMKISQVLTTDNHFRQIGFQVLPV